MAKKQQQQQQKKPASPMEDPPTASSSEEEDSSSSSEDEQEQQTPSSQPPPKPNSKKQQDDEDDDDEGGSSEDEDDDDEDEEEEEDNDKEDEQKKKAASKNPPVIPNSNAKPAASSDSATESGSTSESSPESPHSFALKPKSKSSKPITDPPEQSTPLSKPSKRPADNTTNGQAADAKRTKKNSKGKDPPAPAPPPPPAHASDDNHDDDEDEEVEGKKSAAPDSKNHPFQRLFTDEDEIAILKGMIEFQSKMGADPNKHVAAFYDFVKKSLSVGASSNQLKQKIQRIKKKFETNAGKGKKNGQGPVFAKSHDKELFELSKKVWGNAAANGVVGEKGKSNGRAAAKSTPKKEGAGGRANGTASKKKGDVKLLMDSKDSKEEDSKEEEEGVKMDIDEKALVQSLDNRVGFYGVSEDVVKRGLELMDASERKKLETERKEIQAAEFELAVRRSEFFAKQARAAYQAFKSSNN